MPDETGLSLHDKLAQCWAPSLLVETLPHYLSGELDPQPQDESQATYAPQIKKEEGEIDWSKPHFQSTGRCAPSHPGLEPIPLGTN